jgi:hypothetical protein
MIALIGSHPEVSGATIRPERVLSKRAKMAGYRPDPFGAMPQTPLFVFIHKI